MAGGYGGRDPPDTREKDLADLFFRFGGAVFPADCPLGWWSAEKGTRSGRPPGLRTGLRHRDPPESMATDIHPATKVFQAADRVNRELSSLGAFLERDPGHLSPGRGCGDQFHSLEDRMVKTGVSAALFRCGR